MSNYLRHFGSNDIEDVAESWVEVEISWVEVDEAEYRWVHSWAISKVNEQDMSVLYLNMSSFSAYISGLCTFLETTKSEFDIIRHI